jgi:hypothetical protein
VTVEVNQALTNATLLDVLAVEESVPIGGDNSIITAVVGRLSVVGAGDHQVRFGVLKQRALSLSSVTSLCECQLTPWPGPIALGWCSLDLYHTRCPIPCRRNTAQDQRILPIWIAGCRHHWRAGFHYRRASYRLCHPDPALLRL